MSDYTTRQLLKGDFGAELQLGGVKVERASLDTLRSRAQELDFFYEQDNYVMQQILKRDLKKYMDGYDITRMKLITLDSFVPSFLKKICNVYDNPPSFLLTDDGEKYKAEMEKFVDLMSEVRILQSMSETFEKMRLQNTVVAYVKYNKSGDKIIIDNNYNVGTCMVVTDAEDSLSMTAIAYEQMNDKHEVTWIVWDKELKQHYRLKTKLALPNYDYGKGFQGDRIPIGDNKNYEMPEYDKDYPLPFVTYQYKNHNNSFWGNGLYFLSDLVRSINILLTVCTDDTIQETIRLLILNFNPAGTDGEKGQIKTGMRHPIFVESGGIGSESKPEGQILSADLFNDDVLKLIDKLVEIVSSLHNIDSPLKQMLTDDLSGIAIRMRNEPLLRNWKNDINILTYLDKQLLKKIILVNNYHRKNQPKKVIKPELIEFLEIKYAEPTIVTDEKADFELEVSKWQSGISSPVKWLMKQNPEWTEQEAIDEITKNKEHYAVAEPPEKPNFSFKKVVKEEK